jgi:hypothetical protein
MPAFPQSRGLLRCRLKEGSPIGTSELKAITAASSSACCGSRNYGGNSHRRLAARRICNSARGITSPRACAIGSAAKRHFTEDRRIEKQDDRPRPLSQALLEPPFVCCQVGEHCANTNRGRLSGGATRGGPVESSEHGPHTGGGVALGRGASGQSTPATVRSRLVAGRPGRGRSRRRSATGRSWRA